MADTEQNLRQRTQKNAENTDKTDTDRIKNSTTEGASIPQNNTFNYNPPSWSNTNNNTAYKTASEYNQAVQQWVWQYNMYTNMMWMQSVMPFMFCNMMPSSTSSNNMPGSAVPPNHSQNQGAGQPVVQQTVPQPAPTVNNQGIEFRVPPLWKRVAAEFIDFILLFLIKLGVTLLTVEYVGGIDIERYDIELLFNQNIDYDTAYALTYELVAMEIINRILICIFETLCLRRGVGGMVGGTTPGKGIMKLRVVSCEDIIILPDNKIRVIPAGDIGLWNALVRSVIKNFSLAFFFPVCFTVFFFQQNRAAYDIIATCIVVESPNEELVLW